MPGGDDTTTFLLVRPAGLEELRERLVDLDELGDRLRDEGDAGGAAAANEEAVALLVATRGDDDGATDDDIRELLADATDAASAAGRADRALALRATADGLGDAK